MTVKNGRFVWMDPDEPDRPHKCVPKNAGDTRSEDSAQRPTTSSENAEKRRMKATASPSKQGSDSPSNVSNTPTAHRQALHVSPKYTVKQKRHKDCTVHPIIIVRAVYFDPVTERSSWLIWLFCTCDPRTLRTGSDKGSILSHGAGD